MNKKQVFQRLISDFIEKPLDQVVAREIGIPEDVPKIISLLGPRRAGKTYVLYGLIKRLRQTIPAHRLVYINFEDDRLFPLQLADLDALLQGYYELYPQNKDVQVWFFLDEVQEAEGWEKFARRLIDQENCRVYLTGSSSKLLSRELATALRGRTLPYEVFPLSFREFLSFNGIDPNPHSSKGQALLFHWLRRYLQQGGFPELVFLPEELHRRTINEYIDLMLYRDLVERFSIKSPALLKYLLKHALANMANPMSTTKVYNDLKSQGYAVGKNTVFDYLSYLEEAFILFRVEKWSRSARVQAVNPSKVYAIDPAFKYAMSISEDTGRVFENAVFLELRRRGLPLHYFHEGQEVDFYWEDGQLVNACYSLAETGTLQREAQGLLKAMQHLGLPEGRIITWDEQRTIREPAGTIHIQPLWEFLLA
jgi:uncharacterized protein